MGAGPRQQMATCGEVSGSIGRLYRPATTRRGPVAGASQQMALFIGKQECRAPPGNYTLELPETGETHGNKCGAGAWEYAPL